MNEEKHSIVPIVFMIAFILLLVGMLVLRVYQSDRDLAHLRLNSRQARLAAESGISYAVESMRKMLKNSDRVGDPFFLTDLFFSDIEKDEWIEFSHKNKACFKITSLRQVEQSDDPKTPLQNESLRFRIMTEGKCGSASYSTVAVIQITDLVKTFAVTSSLNDYYYGMPFQQWAENADGFNSFVAANKAFFTSGEISSLGIAHSPSMISRIFKKSGTDLFEPVTGKSKLASNYGAVYRRDGESPAHGPLYCDTPVVVDSHTFFGPVQTALYFFRRSGSQPRISSGNTAVAMNSSQRIQNAADTLQGKNDDHLFIDADSENYCPYLPPWRPDFNYLRELCKKEGLYIDDAGKGFVRGAPINADYHPGEDTFYSDTYFTQTSTREEQDNFKEKYIVLGSDNNFNGYNNINGENLNGARILFSERSVFMRGYIGSDLVIVTPRHIFLTGPTNIDSNLSLFLIAGSGTALSTVDLERIIANTSPTSMNSFVDAAREWHIRAAIYKPGAGVYTTQSAPADGRHTNYRGIFPGRKSLKLKIQGACIGGSLKRWIDNSEEKSFQVVHVPECTDRLFIRPFSIAVYKRRTLQIK